MKSRTSFQKLYRAAFVAGSLTVASAASAARLGHPSYSASAATAAQRQWNIIADPSTPAGDGYATDGSTTTLYSPAVASLDTVESDSPFYLVKIVVSDSAGTNNQIQENFSGAVTSYTFNFTPAQAAGQFGAVQVVWSLTPATTPGVVPPQPAFDPNAPLSADENTDNIIFDNLTSVVQTATFTNYQNPGTGGVPNYFTNADYYEGWYPDPNSEDQPQVPQSFYYGGSENPTQIGSASVTATASIPEPSGIVAAGMASTLLLVRRHRRVLPAVENS
jgi:hypothetical protein